MNKQALVTSEMMALIEETIKNNQEAIFRVQGTSMGPFLKHDLTNVTMSQFTKLSKGDIILFRYNKEFKLHRIIKIKDEQIVARGDNSYQKELINLSDVIGVVVSYETNQKVIYPKSFNVSILLFLWRFIKPFKMLLRSFYGLFRK